MPTQDTAFMAALFFLAAALIIIPVVAAIGWRKATTDGRRGLLVRRPRRFWILWGAGGELILLSEFRTLALYHPQSTMTPWVAAGLASMRTIPIEAGVITLCLGYIVFLASLLTMPLSR